MLVASVGICLGVSAPVHAMSGSGCGPVGVPGDGNCDGQVDSDDIDPFVLYLVSPSLYQANFPGCDASNLDANGDCKINTGDIDTFVELIIAADTSDDELAPQLVSFVPGLGTIGDVAFDGTYAYVASNEFGLAVVDLNEPSNPSLLGTLGASDLPAGSEFVTQVDSQTVVTSGGSHPLRRIDVSDPSAPVIEQTEFTAYRGIAHRDGYLFAGANSVLDVLDVDSLESVASLSIPARDVIDLAPYHNDHMAVIGARTLSIVNVSNPFAPQVVGSLTLPLSLSDRFGLGEGASGDPVLVVGSSLSTQMVMVDVSVASAPQQLGTRTLAGRVRGVSGEGSVVVVGTEQRTYLVDMSVPSAPEFASTLFEPSEVVSMRDGLLLRGASAAMKVAEVNAAVSTDLATLDTNSGTREAVATDGELIAVGGPSIATRFLRKNGDSGIEDLGSVLIAARDLELFDGVAYIASGSRLEIVDPLTGDVINSVSTRAWGLEKVQANGKTWLFVAAMSDGVELYDLSDPESPLFVASADVSGNAQMRQITAHARADGTLVAAAGTSFNEVEVFDFSNFDAPAHLGGFFVGVVQGLASRDGVLAVSGGTQQFVYLYDMNSPSISDPVQLSRITVNATGLAFEGSLLSVTTGLFGMSVYDTSDVNTPQAVGEAMTVSNSTTVAVSPDGEFAVSTDDHGVVNLIDLFR